LPVKKFHEVEEVKNIVTAWLHAQEAEFYDTRIQKLVSRLNICLDKVVSMLKITQAMC
jgi:hypothetical protein